jgi:hypothetical protein
MISINIQMKKTLSLQTWMIYLKWIMNSTSKHILVLTIIDCLVISNRIIEISQDNSLNKRCQIVRWTGMKTMINYKCLTQCTYSNTDNILTFILGNLQMLKCNN